MQTAPADGDTGSLTIATTRDCTWAASSAASWITFTSATSGQGDGNISFRVAANTGATTRHGTLAVNDEQIGIDQDARVCRFVVSPTTFAVGGSGGRVTLSVETTEGCAWTASTSQNWIEVTAGSSGNGSGTATLAVAQNAGPGRSGTVLVAGQTVTITQGENTPSCTPSLTPSALTLPAASGSGLVTVNIANGCAWSAASSASWITITAGTSGSGPGEVRLSIAANPNANARSGMLTIAGLPFPVTQAAASCTYAIDPSSRTIGAGGGTASITVSAPGGCAWSATANAGWITITSGGAGTGNGSVTVRAAENTGAARTGTVTIAGHTLTVTQAAAPCTYDVSPTALSFELIGGVGSVGVTTDGSCAWTAVSNTGWIVVTGGAAGSGNGSVTFTVAPNVGAARTGVITIGGRAVTISQAALLCSYTIEPTSQAFTAAGGTGSVTLTTGGVCVWTASSSAAWITITGGSAGTGSGLVQLSVAANPGPARSGALTLGSQTFSVTQEAPTCLYTVAPTSQPVPAGGGAGSVAVTTAAGCAWTSASGAEWITITDGGSGNVNGMVSFMASPNIGPARIGTLTIAAGSMLTVMQAAP